MKVDNERYPTTSKIDRTASHFRINGNCPVPSTEYSERILNFCIYPSSNFPKKRISECNESSTWEGSNSRRSLLENQLKILNNEIFIGNNAVIGLSVTEDIYSCKKKSLLCSYNTSIYGDFMNYMPRTFLHNNSRGDGWSCAQRRPLRALAHNLLLYDPTYIILADDDTYINYKLIENLYNNIINSDMLKKPLVIGHFILKKTLTIKGLLFGGTGYIIGKKVIERLLTKEVRVMKIPKRDRYTSALALFREIRHTNWTCNEPCLLHFQPVNGSLGLTVRLIDLCVNMMASENTCYHSDYSMSRCLFYGAHIEAIEITCESFDMPKMCSQNSTGVCDELRHLSCHRWGVGSQLEPKLLL
eukprot:gene1221-2373_t